MRLRLEKALVQDRGDRGDRGARSPRGATAAAPSEGCEEGSDEVPQLRNLWKSVAFERRASCPGSRQTAFQLEFSNDPARILAPSAKFTARIFAAI